MEINPPLIMLIYSLPAAAIIWLRIPAALAFQVFSLGLCAGSACSVNRVLARSSLSHEWKARMMDAALCVLFIVPASMRAFGDREHLLLVFSLPWIIQMLYDIKPTWQTALPAAIGFCIKPYNVMVAAGLSLFGGPAGTSLRAKLFSLSSLIIASVAALYLLVMVTGFPLYPFRIVSLLLLTYAKATPAENMPHLVWFTLPALLFIQAGVPAVHERIRWYALILSFAVCFMVNGGWHYTFYLLFAPLVLTCFRVCPDSKALHAMLRNFSGLLRLTLVGLCPLLIVPGVLYLSLTEDRKDIITTHATGHPGSYAHLPKELLAELDRTAGNTFVLLSTDLMCDSVFGVNTSSRCVYAFNMMWPLPWLYAHPDDSRASVVKEALVTPLIAALKYRPHPVLIVNRSPIQTGLPQSADILAYLRKQTPELENVLETYTLQKTIDYCNVEWKFPSPFLTHPEKSRCRFDVWTPKNNE